MKLEEVKIHRYKCIEEQQSFEVDDQVSILVGMNESGKTSVLEALAKSHYFEDDEAFKYNTTHDYPRRFKKAMEKTGEIPDAVTLKYVLEKKDVELINELLGSDTLANEKITVTVGFENKQTWNDISCNDLKFVEHVTGQLGISSETLNKKLVGLKNVTDLDELIATYSDPDKIEGLSKLKEYYKNSWKWPSPFREYLARRILGPMLPKFLYYDEYYTLPSRISIQKLQDEVLDDEEMKTAKALFDLAEINIEELIDSADFEDYKAELEATEAIISDELFKYWSSNRNLEIQFDIDKIPDPDGEEIIEHVLDIRVRNSRSKVSLPLKNRSKGFNWFFSFLVWFKKIQEDKDTKYILLLDEPGLNLHAAAQEDLLNFIEDLAADYQVIYTTHSPFMIPSEKLDRVRTVVETKDGAQISDSIQEKDPNTLFPLQAALGYNIAQNLFISKSNLLVEGVADLIILQTISALLEQDGKPGLRGDITIVPTGGLDKVGTFISLLRGSRLKIACLLDTFNDKDGKAKSKMEDLIKGKIINKNKIRFFDEFLDGFDKADLEDLFTKSDYLNIFNAAFTEHSNIKVSDVSAGSDPRIISQINNRLGVKRFNHYRPANYLAAMGASVKDLEKESLDNFTKVIEAVNKMFD